MDKWTRLGTLAACALTTLSAGALAAADSSIQRADASRQKEVIGAIFDKMPRDRMKLLSSAALNVAQWARDDAAREQPQEEAAVAVTSGHHGHGHGHGDGDEHRIPVNDASTDFTRSVLTGFTQSESSTAWCGDTVVVGFNDSGSLLETLGGPGGLSFNGVARSDDRGRSFEDLGFLNPGPDPAGLLAGDPVLGCSSPSRFQYSSIFFLLSGPTPLSAVSVSTSTDGGTNWGDPVIAAGKDATQHVLDKEWMAVDPEDPKRVYVTYTDFGSFNSDAGCPDDFPTAIELVRSTDGGDTWSAPVVLDLVCGANAFVQASQVVVGPAGEVNVAWEHAAQGIIDRVQLFRRSKDGGLTFGPKVKVSDVVCGGDCFVLEGGFREGLEFPSLAVDRSDKKTAGRLYLAWHDGRNKQVLDEGAPLGVYGYTDILVSRSEDGGATWSRLETVNHDRPSRMTDQYQPGIAVDRRGNVAVCYYDRSLDPTNFRITRSCSIASHGGKKWSFRRITGREDSFIPFHGDDTSVNPVYMGDYDSLASETLLGEAGFVGGFLIEGFHGNQNVFANRLGLD
jgi:hypothetical protein